MSVNVDLNQTLIQWASWPTPDFSRQEYLDYEESYMGLAHQPDNLLKAFLATVPHDVPIDTLVGTGLSGAIAVVNLARDLKMNYLIVRKPGVSTHAEYPVEGRLGKNWLFVDDVISTGATFERTFVTVEELPKYGFETTYRGTFLYSTFYPEYRLPDGTLY